MSADVVLERLPANAPLAAAQALIQSVFEDVIAPTFSAEGQQAFAAYIALDAMQKRRAQGSGEHMGVAGQVVAERLARSLFRGAVLDEHEADAG